MPKNVKVIEKSVKNIYSKHCNNLGLDNTINSKHHLDTLKSIVDNDEINPAAGGEQRQEVGGQESAKLRFESEDDDRKSEKDDLESGQNLDEQELGEIDVLDKVVEVIGSPQLFNQFDTALNSLDKNF